MKNYLIKNMKFSDNVINDVTAFDDEIHNEHIRIMRFVEFGENQQTRYYIMHYYRNCNYIELIFYYNQFEKPIITWATNNLNDINIQCYAQFLQKYKSLICNLEE